MKEGEEDKIEKPKVLEYNRYNYGMITAYISAKERTHFAQAQSRIESGTQIRMKK